MSPERTYKDYVTDQDLYRKYSKYQKRYFEKIRESDRVLIEMIGEVVSDTGVQDLSLLDIGCSTGGLLFHIKKALPGLRLAGGDKMAPVIQDCRKNPDLKGRAASQWQRDHVEKLKKDNMTDKERLALSGKSSQGFHYLGSLKFYSQAGEAFANALVSLDKGN